MGRIYHKPHPHEPNADGTAQETVQGAKRMGSRLVTDISRVLDDHPWLYYFGFGTLGGAWGLGGWLVVGLHGRSAMLLGGVLLIAGGFVEIVLSRALSRARDACPDWLRFWEEGWIASSIEYSPATFRFFGSAVAGAGCGALVWAMVPNMVAAALVGVIACLGIWAWTWSAFAEMED
jgi:hypothetical protein